MSRRSALRGSAFALALSMLTCGFFPGRAADVWVDDCAGTGAGTVGNPYCKIQTAICSIKTVGGIVHVLPGTYNEAIRVIANVQIISTCRPGARIRGTGRISRHASGNAIDFNAGGRKGAVVQWLIANHRSGARTPLSLLVHAGVILLAIVAFSSFHGDLVGQVFALFVLTVAAGEAAIGLAIVVVYFRNRGSIAVEDINMMKG